MHGNGIREAFTEYRLLVCALAVLFGGFGGLFQMLASSGGSAPVLNIVLAPVPCQLQDSLSLAGRVN